MTAQSDLPEGNGGFVAFVAERIGSLDRRLEEMGRGIHARIDRQSDETNERLREIRQAQEKVKLDHTEELEERDVRISDIERTTQMVKGGLLVISALVVPAALLVLDHVLR